MNDRITIVGTNGNKTQHNFERLHILTESIVIECAHSDYTYKKTEIKSITIEFN